MARVIRGARPPEVVAHDEAERLRSEARADAERIRSEARADAERLREQASEQAREQARAELAAGWVALERARKEPSRELVVLAGAIASRLVSAELALAPDKVRAIAREALALVPNAEQVRVRVSPGDVGALEALGVPLEPDPSMERGGCVVHTELGDVDARVEVRLEALLRAIERAG